MDHTKKGEFVEEGGELVYKEERTYPLSDTGCVYLTKKPGDEPHMMYKLTQIPEKKGFFWAALWNTCCYSGHKTDKPGYSPGSKKWQQVYKTMGEAIRTKLKDGWEVKRMVASQFMYQVFRT